MNLFFPFGAGEFGNAQSLIHNGTSHQVAVRVVFYNRVFEVLAIQCVLVASFAYLGWEGALAPVFWGGVLVAAIGSVTRPLGHPARQPGRFNPFARIWSAFHGRAVARATAELFDTPGFVIGLSLMSVVTLALEVVGYWNIKQAFSSPMDDYVLMKDLRFIDFAIVIVVASMARVLPYTFASLGVYELASVVMFRVFDEGFLSGTTVTLLDSVLVNGLSLLMFAVFLWRGRCPSVLETWQGFFKQSESRWAGDQASVSEAGSQAPTG